MDYVCFQSRFALLSFKPWRFRLNRLHLFIAMELVGWWLFLFKFPRPLDFVASLFWILFGVIGFGLDFGLGDFCFIDLFFGVHTQSRADSLNLFDFSFRLFPFPGFSLFGGLSVLNIVVHLYLCGHCHHGFESQKVITDSLWLFLCGLPFNSFIQIDYPVILLFFWNVHLPVHQSRVSLLTRS